MEKYWELVRVIPRFGSPVTLNAKSGCFRCWWLRLPMALRHRFPLFGCFVFHIQSEHCMLWALCGSQQWQLCCQSPQHKQLFNLSSCFWASGQDGCSVVWHPARRAGLVHKPEQNSVGKPRVVLALSSELRCSSWHYVDPFVQLPAWLSPTPGWWLLLD